MDPILAQLLASDPALAAQAGFGPQTPPPPVAPPADQTIDPFAGLEQGAPAPQPAPSPEASAASAAPPTGYGFPGGPLAPGQSRSHSGTDLGTVEALDKSPATKRVEKGRAGLEQGIQSNLADYQQQNTAIGERGKANALRTGELEAGRAAETAAAAQKQAAAQMAQARDLQAINDAAWQGVAQHQADFQSQLATVRAMRINPNQWYQDRDEGQKTTDAVHSAVAMYWMASGKPAMQELGKTVLGQFEKRVEQNIDAQVENLKNQQQVSEGFRMAWQLASQNAVSEVEAKARVKAMLLQSHKDALAADIGAKYDSDLARAGAEQVSISIDKGILDANQKATQEAEKGLIDIAQMKSQEYMARLRAAVDREQMAAAKDKTGGAASINALLVADPETGERRFIANDADSKKKIDAQALASKSFEDSMGELDAALRRAGGRAIGRATSLSMLMDSEDRTVAALAHRAAMEYAEVLDPGSKTSDKDYISNLARGIPVAGVLDRSTGEEGRRKVRELTVRTLRNGIRQYTTDVDPEHLPPGIPRWGAGSGPGAPESAMAGAAAAATEKPAVASPVDKAAAVFKTPKAREIDWKTVEDADRNWLVYATEGGLLDGRRARANSIAYRGGKSPNLREPGWADDMSLLSATAADTRLDEKERERARNELIRIRDLTDSENVDAAQYAQWLLNN